MGLVPGASTKAMQTMKTAKAMKAMKCAKVMKAMKAMKAKKFAAAPWHVCERPGMYANALAMTFAAAMKNAWDVHNNDGTRDHWVPSVRSKWHVYRASYEPPHCPCCPDWVRMRAMKCPDWELTRAMKHRNFGRPLPQDSPLERTSHLQ